MGANNDWMSIVIFAVHVICTAPLKTAEYMKSLSFTDVKGQMIHNYDKV